jgi:type II restriction enzyme
MQLEMDSTLGTGYKSGSQIARRVTEHWGKKNLFCASCDAPQLQATPCNTRAVDFACNFCGECYQMKASRQWNERRIPDGAYSAMTAAIASDHVPNLLILQYTPAWTVQNLMLVPSFFFTASSIEKRKPLGQKAQRAGWIGCNILLSAIAPEGKIQVVHNGTEASSEFVRQQFAHLRPLAQIPPRIRGMDIRRFTYGAIFAKQKFFARGYLFERSGIGEPSSIE